MWLGGDDADRPLLGEVLCCVASDDEQGWETKTSVL